MTAKEYLTQALTLHKLIKAKKYQIQKLRELQADTGVILQKDKVQTSRKLQPIADLSDAIIDLADEYAQEVVRLLRLKHDIKTAIDNLPNPVHRLILEERYINLKRWEDVAADNGYSWKGVHKIHSKALKEIKEYIEVHYNSVI